jgi:hypothetical protein
MSTITPTAKKNCKTADYSREAIIKRLQNLYNSRKHWFFQRGITRPEDSLIYALERLGTWVPYCKNYTAINLYNKVAKCQADIVKVLPLATGKQATFRMELLNDIQFCNANAKEVTNGTTN